MSHVALQQQYKVLIERDEDGYFVASVPALPGCHTQAKTMSELTRRVKDAIQLCTDVAKKNPQYRKKMQMFAYEPTFIGMETVTV